MESELNKPESLYSYFGICLATFFGGPFAGGILIYQNLFILGKERQGQLVIIAFLAFQILIFSTLWVVPNYFFNQIPSFLIPFISAIAVYFKAKKLMGEEIQFRESQNMNFLSNWMAAGVGLLVLIPSSIIFLFLAWGTGLGEDPPEVISFIQKFEKNEEITSDFYAQFTNLSEEELAEYFRKIYVPAWEENKQLIEELRNSEVDLNWDYQRKLDLLDSYTFKKIEIAEVFLKDYKNRHSTYIEDMDLIFKEIVEIQWELEAME